MYMWLVPTLSRRTATTRLSPKAARHRRRQGVANIRSGGLSPRKHSPDGDTGHIRLNGLLLIYRPLKDERLSRPSWLTCSGRFTHIVVTRRLQAKRRTGSVRWPKTGVLPTVLCNQPITSQGNISKRLSIVPFTCFTQMKQRYHHYFTSY